jgi:transposase-like protein
VLSAKGTPLFAVLFAAPPNVGTVVPFAARGGRQKLDRGISYTFLYSSSIFISSMSKKRITYTAAFKAKVALTAVKQEKTISQLAAQFKVHPIVISRWKAQLLENAEVIFQDGRVKKKSDDSNIDELYQEIGRLKVELDWLKKKSAAFD